MALTPSNKLGSSKSIHMTSDINQQQTQKEAGALGALGLFVARGHVFLAKSDLAAGHVKIWISGVRANVRKIYGEDSEVLGLLPQIDSPMSPQQAREVLIERLDQLEYFLTGIVDVGRKAYSDHPGGKVFIGHGRSPIWREVKDFISDRLHLPWDEFNREAVAGLPTFERLSQMLNDACFGFLIMTAEDEHTDATLHARENVIHEVGLFQGHLGPRKAIVLLETGCQEFSNIHGLTQLRFPKGHISAAFEEMRRVLEREHILRT